MQREMPKGLSLEAVLNGPTGSRAKGRSPSNINKPKKKRGRPPKVKEEPEIEVFPPSGTSQHATGIDVFNGLTGHFSDIIVPENDNHDVFSDSGSVKSNANSECNFTASSFVSERQHEDLYLNGFKHTQSTSAKVVPTKKLKTGSRKEDLSQFAGDHDGLEFVRPSELEARVKERRDQFEIEDDLTWDGIDNVSEVGSEKSASGRRLTYLQQCVDLSPRMPDELFCGDVIDRLVLPPSSSDLLIQNEIIMPTLEVYEVLRRFHQVLRLTPFKFEDFCAVLQINESSQLLAEIHISLMKIILKTEESFGYVFTPYDSKFTFDLVVHFIDEATWPVIVSDYIMSLKSCPSPVQEAVLSPRYPFVNVAYRIAVLKTLVGIFSDLEIIRNELNSDGQIVYDTKCRRCGDPGNLLCCDNCPAVYHLQCIKPPLETIPEHQWLCSLCEANQLPGVNEVSLSDEADDFTSVLSPKNECLGHDRHLRRYWFVARRLIIEKGDFVRYYSQMEQVNYIIESLDAVCYEEALHTRLTEVQSVMSKHMSLTMDMTQSLEDKMVATDPDLKMVMTEDLLEFEEFIKEQTELRMDEMETKDENDEKVLDSHEDFDWITSDIILEDLDFQQYDQEAKVHDRLKSENLFTLGMEETVKQYVNFFNNHSLSMNRSQAKEIEDRRRHLGYKFCLEPEFELASNFTGTEEQVVTGLKQTIKQIEDNLPSIFMLDDWSVKYPRGINSMLGYHAAPSDIINAFLTIQRHIKPSLFLPIWRDCCSSMGFWVKFFQPKKELEPNSGIPGPISSSKESVSIPNNASFWTSMQNETAKMMNECISDDYYQALSDAGIEHPVFVSIPLKHNLYKTRGELYRQKGHGWVWMKRKKKSKFTQFRKLKVKSEREDDGFELQSHEKTEKKKVVNIKIEDTTENNKDTSASEDVIKMSSLFPSRSLNENVKRNTQLRNLLDVRLNQKLTEEICDQQEVKNNLSSIIEFSEKIAKVDREVTSLGDELDYISKQRLRIENVLEERKNLTSCYSCSKIALHFNERNNYECYSPLCNESKAVIDRLREIAGSTKLEKVTEKLQNFDFVIKSKRERLKTFINEKSQLKDQLATAKTQIIKTKSTALVHKLVSVQKAKTKSETPFRQMNSRHDQNIFTLPNYQLKRFAQSGLGSVCDVPSANFSHKPMTSAVQWPYFCERPSTKHTWEYRLENEVSNQASSVDVKNDVKPSATFPLPCTLSTIAVLIRVFHACVRWEELTEIEKSIMPQNVAVNFLNKGFAYRFEMDNGSAIIKDPQNIRDVAPLFVETEFLLRIVHLPNDRGGTAMVNNCLKDAFEYEGEMALLNETKRRVRRSGRTPKFKKSLLSNTERSVETRWVSEVDLQLWEVKYMLERRKEIIAKFELEKQKKAEAERMRALQKAAEEKLKAAKNAQGKPDREFGVWSDSDEDKPPISTPPKAIPQMMPVQMQNDIKAADTPKSTSKVVIVRCADGTTKQLVLNTSTPSPLGSGQIRSVHVKQADGVSRPIRIIPIKATSLSSPSMSNVMSPVPARVKNHSLISSSEKDRNLQDFVRPKDPDQPSVQVIPGKVKASNQEIARSIVSSYLETDYQFPAKQNSAHKHLREDRTGAVDSNEISGIYDRHRMQLSPRKVKRRDEALTRKQTLKKQQISTRHNKKPVQRKRKLMKEQINLELMFEKNKVPLSRVIYERPYNSVTHKQLLPDNDNDSNMSCSSSSELENDQITTDDNEVDSTSDLNLSRGASTSENMPKLNAWSFPESSAVLKIQQPKIQGSNLISTGKRGRPKKQNSEKVTAVSVKKEKAEKRKLGEAKSTSDSKRVQGDPELKNENKVHQNRREVFEHITAYANKQDAMAQRQKGGKNDHSAPLVKRKRVETKDNTSQQNVETVAELSVATKGSQLRFGDKETLHCICKTFYDHTKFYLKCDLCLNWFHGKCVGINAKKAKNMTDFLCPNCKENSSKNELYCICQTPYNESEFYIGCDECGDWFHGACVGIEPEEASKIDNYFCPNCKTEEKESADSNFNFTLEPEHFELLSELMTVLMDHTHSWPFNEPSTDEEYPNYSKVVTNPICFRDISEKVSCRHYTNFSDFNSDMNRVFENARKYHWKKSSEFQCCDIVEKELVTFLTSFRQSISQTEEDNEEKEDEGSERSEDENSDAVET